MKTMEINELISELKEYDGELTVKVWSNGAEKPYPISNVAAQCVPTLVSMTAILLTCRRYGTMQAKNRSIKINEYYPIQSILIISLWSTQII